ncbi:MAG: hypothetical protein ACRDT8_04860 [Micromonosporaceae bacterium]
MTSPQQPPPPDNRREPHNLTTDRPSLAEQGGEPACWLPKVCDECGRLAEAEPPTRCPRCGAEIGVD